MVKNKSAVFGWALYDFANTIFSMNVVSLYFVLWVTVDRSREDIIYSIALSGSLMAAAVLDPLLGTLSDIYRKKLPFLIGFTALACFFTALLGLVKTLLWALVIFALANIAYQTAGVLYNALLIRVSERKEIGTVSGIGTGFGYVGAVTGLALTRPFVLKHGYGGAFIPTAALFLLFSLPCFFLVKERKEVPVYAAGFKNIFGRMKETFSNSAKYPHLLRFLAAAFVFLNGVNTIVVFMSVYLKKVTRFSDEELIALYLFSTIAAIAGSFLSGVLADKVGPKRCLSAALFLWIACFIAGFFAHGKLAFWIIGPFIGAALGSTWTSSRAFLIRLCPEEKLGEAFGLLGTVGKSSAMVGPLVWGLIVLVFGFTGVFKYRLALLAQAIFVFSGFCVMKRIPD